MSLCSLTSQSNILSSQIVELPIRLIYAVVKVLARHLSPAAYLYDKVLNLNLALSGNWWR